MKLGAGTPGVAAQPRGPRRFPPPQSPPRGAGPGQPRGRGAGILHFEGRLGAACTVDEPGKVPGLEARDSPVQGGPRGLHHPAETHLVPALRVESGELLAGVGTISTGAIGLPTLLDTNFVLHYDAGEVALHHCLTILPRQQGDHRPSCASQSLRRPAQSEKWAGARGAGQRSPEEGMHEVRSQNSFPTPRG